MTSLHEESAEEIDEPFYEGQIDETIVGRRDMARSD